MTLNSSDQLTMLEQLHHLEALHLSDVHIEPESRTHLRMPRLPALRALSCFRCQFRGDGLEDLSSLEFLSLSGTPANLEVLEKLTELPQLRMLSLGNNVIFGEQLRHLARLSQIETLELASPHIADNELRHLAKLANLRTLMLRGGGVSDDSIQPLKQLENLEYLDLRGCWQITDAGKDEIRSALPNCEVY